MKLAELKEMVRYEWEQAHKYQWNSVLQPQNFKPDIRRYGDLRRKQTWIKAYAGITAQLFRGGIAYPWDLITICFNPNLGEPSRNEYLPEVLQAFLEFPEGLDSIKEALESLYQYDRYSQKQKESYCDGFFELVERTGGGRGLPTELIRRPTLSAA